MRLPMKPSFVALAFALATPVLLALACGSSGSSRPNEEEGTAGATPAAGGAQSGVANGGMATAAGAGAGGVIGSGAVGGTDAPTGGMPSPPRDPFDVVTEGVAADIYVDAADHAAVVRAVGDLQADVKRVSGAEPAVSNTLAGLSSRAILVGTLGHSPVIDDLVAQGKLDAAGITGKWESFVIQAVTDPAPGISRALVVAGSDRRGTIYGVYDVSQAIGVSPWYWWADVTPIHSTNVTVEGQVRKQGEPSVKYRGIFLNDEENFSTWSALKMDAGKHAGPETYKRVFELLLRLKANFLWPAMHAVSDEFHSI